MATESWDAVVHELGGIVQLQTYAPSLMLYVQPPIMPPAFDACGRVIGKAKVQAIIRPLPIVARLELIDTPLASKYLRVRLAVVAALPDVMKVVWIVLAVELHFFA